MRSIITAILVFACSIGCAGLGANPSEEAPPEDSNLDAFWADFQGAVAASDGERVASLTAFPLRGANHLLEPAGNAKNVTKGVFLRRYDEVMTRPLRAAVGAAGADDLCPSLADASVLVLSTGTNAVENPSTAPLILDASLYFAPHDDSYQFVEIGFSGDPPCAY